MGVKHWVSNLQRARTWEVQTAEIGWPYKQSFFDAYEMKCYLFNDPFDKYGHVGSGNGSGELKSRVGWAWNNKDDAFPRSTRNRWTAMSKTRTTNLRALPQRKPDPPRRVSANQNYSDFRRSLLVLGVFDKRKFELILHLNGIWRHHFQIFRGWDYQVGSRIASLLGAYARMCCTWKMDKLELGSLCVCRQVMTTTVVHVRAVSYLRN